jgi:hypothetical protein
MQRVNATHRASQWRCARAARLAGEPRQTAAPKRCDAAPIDDAQ